MRRKIKGRAAPLRGSAKQKKPESKPRITRFPLCGYVGCRDCGFGKGVKLGSYHSFAAFLAAPTDAAPAALRVGCRNFASPTASKRHWRGGFNPAGAPRPRSSALIAKASAVAKAMRWTWGRAISARKAQA